MLTEVKGMQAESRSACFCESLARELSLPPASLLVETVVAKALQEKSYIFIGVSPARPRLLPLGHLA